MTKPDLTVDEILHKIKAFDPQVGIDVDELDKAQKALTTLVEDMLQAILTETPDDPEIYWGNGEKIVKERAKAELKKRGFTK